MTTYTSHRFISHSATKFNKSKLPTPRDYLQAMGIKTTKAGQYLKLCCPFHDDGSPSMSMHSAKGFYKCFSCDAKGGDLIAFHQRLRGISFVDACKQLGIWEGK